MTQIKLPPKSEFDKLQKLAKHIFDTYPRCSGIKLINADYIISVVKKKQKDEE